MTGGSGRLSRASCFRTWAATVAFRVPGAAKNRAMKSNQLILRSAGVGATTARAAAERVAAVFSSGGYDSQNGAD